MILFIDTTDFNQVIFALAKTEDSFLKRPSKTRKAVIRRSFKNSRQKSFKILSLLEKFLTAAGCDLGVIKKIVLIVGEGSFTGMRVGSAIAQALSLALNLPIKYQEKKQNF